MKITQKIKVFGVKTFSKLKAQAKTLEFWLTFLAYAIPIGFLLYVLYINFLPFGYNKTFTIDVGSANDTKVGTFYLEPSKDLSERKTGIDENGKEYTYRELNGVAYAVFKPNVVLKDAEITIEVEGDEGISIIPPVIDFNPDDITWDYAWDFTQGKTPEELGLVGNAFPFDGAMYFDGKSRLELPDSADKFEDGPFTVYAEWTPVDSENNAQQIVGHYNWEIYQNKDSVEFRVGRMNDAQGPFYSIKYPIENTEDFFNTKHELIATYSPDPINGNGYIDLYVNKNLAGRTYLERDIISPEYNGRKNITLGKSDHGGGNFIKGYTSKIFFKNSVPYFTIAPQASFKKEMIIPFYDQSNKKIEKITFKIIKK